MSKKAAAGSEEEYSFLDRFSVFDVFHQLVVVGTWLVLFLGFAVVVWTSYGLYTHWMAVQESSYNLLSAQYAAKERLLRSFCDKEDIPELSEECRKAREFVGVAIRHRVFDMVIQEHLDHLPFVAHCRTTSDCRSMLFSLNEGLRSSLWYVMIILAVGVAVALSVAVRVSCSNCWRVNREYQRRRQAGLPFNVSDPLPSKSE